MNMCCETDTQVKMAVPVQFRSFFINDCLKCSLLPVASISFIFCSDSKPYGLCVPKLTVNAKHNRSTKKGGGNRFRVLFLTRSFWESIRVA